MLRICSRCAPRFPLPTSIGTLRILLPRSIHRSRENPKIRYLLLADIQRLLDYLKARQQGYGSALTFQLANALFQNACRFDELVQLS
jgi:integrase